MVRTKEKNIALALLTKIDWTFIALFCPGFLHKLVIWAVWYGD